MSIHAERFRALHESGCFLIPNAWDAGSAKLLARAGAQAIATTSAGLAFALGRPDGAGAVSRSEAIENGRMIAAAVPLPVSADLEDGYGPTPDDPAATVAAAIEAGLCGCTIEDTTADPARPLHTFDAALTRIRAVVAAVAPRPVNVLAGPRDGLVPLAALEAAGVRRVSVGGAIARAAYAAATRIGGVLLAGDLAAALHGIPGHAEINDAMR